MKVIGASVVSAGATPLLGACVAQPDPPEWGGATTTKKSTTTATTTADGAGGAGGAGGAPSQGGAGGATQTGTTTDSTTTTSTTTTTSSTTSTSTTSSGPPCTQSPTGKAIGAPANFAKDGLYKVGTAKVILGRDGGGFYAMAAACTHAGCNMAGGSGQLLAGSTEVECLCHGSVFDADGNVLQGPAYDPLPHVLVELGCDGQLWVDHAKQVSAGTRLAV